MKKTEHLLSVTEVKNILKQESKETLIDLFIDSYKTIPQLKEYITIKYANQDAVDQVFETYKNKIRDVFFPKSMRAQFKIGEAKKLLMILKNCVQMKNF